MAIVEGNSRRREELKGKIENALEKTAWGSARILWVRITKTYL
jgi:hypothetical protein